jgi:hypothetical protein
MKKALQAAKSDGRSQAPSFAGLAERKRFWLKEMREICPA